MSQVLTVSKTTMPYAEVRELFSKGRLKLRKQKGTTLRKVRKQQASMKPVN